MAVEWTPDRLGTHALNNQQPGPYRREFPDIQDPPASQQTSADVNIPKTPVTVALVAINVVIFVAMSVVSAGLPEQARGGLANDWGIDYGPWTLGLGQYWRLLSSMFLHENVMHIGLNMYALWIGRSTEILYGRSKFLVIYLIAGLGGSLTSLLVHPDLKSLGASGAIAGIFGAFFVFFRWHAPSFQPEVVKSVTSWIVTLIIINTVWGFVIPHIDNAAHVGGFVLGVMTAIACVPKDPRSHAWSIRNVVAVGALVVALYFGLQLDMAHFEALKNSVS